MNLPGYQGRSKSMQKYSSTTSMKQQDHCRPHQTWYQCIMYLYNIRYIQYVMYMIKYFAVTVHFLGGAWEF